MSGAELFQRLWRKAELVLPSPSEFWRKTLWRLRGASIGRGTRLPVCRVTWPHQVRIGSHCELHPGIFFNYSHYWAPGPSIIIGDRVMIGAWVEFNCRARIEVGNDCLIASGCRLVDSDHGMACGQAMRDQPVEAAPIILEPGAWLGFNCVVLKGVRIGAGAVAGAGSVVVSDIPAGEIHAGVPARRVGCRG